jgi:hypothetical protein
MLRVIKSKYFFIFSVFSLFLLHQVINIFIGGNTYDELFLIYESGNIYNKIILFFTDIQNPALTEINPYEFYGYLVILPIYIISSSSKVNYVFQSIFSNNSLINIQNKDEVLYILMHLLLNFYVILIIFLIWKKLNEIYSVNFSNLFIFFLCFTPSFIGHAMFNIKDIPYALQIFLGTVYFVNYFIKNNLGNSLFNKELLIVGFTFGLAGLVRINSYAFLGLASFFFLIVKIRQKGAIRNYLVNNAFIYFISIITIIIGTPPSWLNPFKWFKSALDWQFFYTWTGTTLTNGKFIDAENMTSTYLLEWFSFRMPMIYLPVIFITGYFVFKKKTSLATNYFFFFVVTVNLLFIIFRPSAYDGIRQFLFLIPFLIILFIESISQTSFMHEIKIFIFIFCGAYLIFTQIGLGAYKYTYFNELVQTENISSYCENIDGCGDWSSDYWGFSGKEMANLINLEYMDDIDYLLSCKPPQSVNTYLDYRINTYRNVLDIVDLGQSEFHVVSFHRPRKINDSCRFDTNKFIYSCNEIDKITTRLRNGDLNLSYLSLCGVKKK